MKTLAVVTIAFLPATFVAVCSLADVCLEEILIAWQTLFAMPMFEWDSGGKHTVNSKFWVYWVVSIPLTLIIIAGWRVWWHFQKNYYSDAYLNPYQPSAVHVGKEGRSDGGVPKRRMASPGTINRKDSRSHKVHAGPSPGRE